MGYPGMAPQYSMVYNSNPTEKNFFGTWALVLGILSFVCLGLFAGIPAIILGVAGRRAADEGKASNRGMATAGMVLGIIGAVLVAIGWVSYFRTS